MIRRLILVILVALMVPEIDACTSAVVSARASATGRPLLWKHRDTGAKNNFLERVEATDTTYGYVGLFNGGDSLLREAWMGANDRGFAIMNTASYNLAPDTAVVKDREGVVMSLALGVCATVDDFERLLDTLPRPMGVQANFGVIDACGGAAYFETYDSGYRRFDAGDGLIVRTNFSMSGKPGEGYGYIRYNTANQLISEADSITPALFTEGLSRSFYHSLTGRDYLAGDERYVADRDFIPRDISTASIVVEGVNSPDDVAELVLWSALGYPPCAPVHRVTLEEIPEDLRPSGEGYTSPACSEAMELRRSLAPYTGGSWRSYLDLEVLRGVVERMHRASMREYER